jgi:hypothetical protein
MSDNDGFQTVASRKKKQVKQETKIKPIESAVQPPKEVHNITHKVNHNDLNLQNKKRILCSNMITTHECPYGNTCVYAHSLKEQNIDPIRKKIYRMLDNSNMINDIDFVHDNELYKVFVQLTRTCYTCENGTCMGGYNCKKGAIDRKHTICYDDLYNNTCKFGSACDKVHLTKRGLVPKAIQEKMMNPLKDETKQLYIEQLMSIAPTQFNINDIDEDDDNLKLDYVTSEESDDLDDDVEVAENEYIMVLQPI